jgi:hypothetical protein
MPDREETPSYFALSPDGRMLAVASYRRTRVGNSLIFEPALTLWEVATGQVRRRLVGHTGGLTALAFSPDGALASASEDATVLLWEGLGPVGRPPGGALSAGDVAGRWQGLADTDAARAYDAMRGLARSPREAVAWLRQVLRPAGAPDPRRAAALLRDLDSDTFAVRRKAAAELEDFGEGAAPLLREALKKPLGLEARRRVEGLLAQVDPLKSMQSHRLLRTVEVLEAIASPEARRLLETLAGGLPEARLTQEAKGSLQRLARRSEAQP